MYVFPSLHRSFQGSSISNRSPYNDTAQHLCCVYEFNVLAQARDLHSQQQNHRSLSRQRQMEQPRETGVAHHTRPRSCIPETMTFRPAGLEPTVLWWSPMSHGRTVRLETYSDIYGELCVNKHPMCFHHASLPSPCPLRYILGI